MQHLQPNATLQSGKFRIDRVLGQGGFGITYLAEHCILHSRVAIKEFFIDKLCNRDVDSSKVYVGSVGSIELVERFKEKFLKEARLLFNMDNRYIVRVFDAFEENGTAYYVMEYLDNGSLNNMLTHVAFSEDTALKFTRQIAEALGYIHERNVLHLDVKPANILLRKNGDVALIDFGISKRYDDAGGQTSTTPVGISQGYAPLEQYHQGVQAFSPCTDIYSLGATMYKMVTGNTPPEATIVNEEGLPEKPNTITDSTWNAIVKAMNPRKKDRPQSINEFLEIIGANEPVIPVVEDVEADDGGETTMIESRTFDFYVKGVKFKMVKVEGGTFTMGATKNEILDGDNPAHIVTLTNDYYIGQTEVTQNLWEIVMGCNPSRFKGNNRPVENVSWDDCQMLISKLNSITGKQFRLPTEAEWEFAARGGNNSKGFIYSGSNNLFDVAFFYDNCCKEGGHSPAYGTHDVATLKPNELGIYDMSGNVYEWCSDWYGDYESHSPENPVGPMYGEFRVFRGGSWNRTAKYCILSDRNNSTTNFRKDYLGLRLALTI